MLLDGSPAPDARDHPLAFGNLLLDPQLEIRIRLTHTADVLLRTLGPHGIPAVIADLHVIGRMKRGTSSTAPVLTTSS
jgi:hypothetical protein